MRPVDGLDSFRAAGRALFSLGLVMGSQGNLSTFDGERLVITRTGAALSELTAGDVLMGGLSGELPGASSDLAVHRRRYRADGPGAIVHAHPPGSVPDGAPESGLHGVYVFASSLEEAVRETVRRARHREEVAG
jgi:ribulose-5-phosphate 4-epimerase/fuculose-1-phosphate aldolase